jgi:disulfide bond formation protein DsbB
MMRKNTEKNIMYLMILITIFVLAASYFFEYVKGLHPCPLCLMQRLCISILLVLTGLILVSRRRFRGLLISDCLFAGAGLFFAGRQLWLQSLPTGQAPACMPGLDVLIQYFPWQAVAKALFWGSGDCAEVSWTFMGISMPGWSAIYFLVMLALSIRLLKSMRTMP